MKLSDLIKQAQATMDEHGDLDVLDHDEYSIGSIEVADATPSQLKWWGQPPDEPFRYAQIISER
jgi:hypothetical protein